MWSWVSDEKTNCLLAQANSQPVCCDVQRNARKARGDAVMGCKSSKVPLWAVVAYVPTDAALLCFFLLSYMKQKGRCIGA
eukprot:1161641-Pelagomonas_calceolata.AAC.4